MLMVEDNVGNQFRPNAVQNVENQVVLNAVQNSGVQNVGNQNGLSVDLGIANQYRIGNVVTARAEGNAKRDAAYLQTQLQIAQKEDATFQLNYEEFNFMAAAGAYDELEKMDQLSMEQGGGTVEQHPATVEGTRAYFESLYNNLAIEVEKLSKEKSNVSSLQEEKKKLKSDFKIREDELLDKQIQLENKIKELDNILKQQSLYNGKVLLEKHDPPAVYDSEETLQLAQESRLKMKQLNKEIKPANYAKINHLSGVFVSQTAKSREELYFLNTSKTANVSKSILIPNEEFQDYTTPSVAQKILNEVKSTIVTLQRVVKQKMTLDIHNWSSSVYQEIYKIIKDEIFPIVNQVDSRVQNFKIQFLKEASKFVRDFKPLANEADESLAKHKALELEIERLLRAVVNQDIMSIVQRHNQRYECEYSVLKAINFGKTTFFFWIKTLFCNSFPKSKGLPKIDESHALSKPVTSNSAPSSRVSNVVNNEKVIAVGIFRINPFKASRVNNFVPNKHVKASVRTKPITVSRPYVITKKDVHSNTNDLSPKNVESTTRTRRPQPRNNLNNDKVPSKSKSIFLLNKLEKIEENHRSLQSSTNQKHTANQKKNKPKASKPKNVGSKERLASPRPSKPRSCLRWSPTGRISDLCGKITSSSNTESESDTSVCDNASASNPQELINKGFPSSTSFLGRIESLLDDVWITAAHVCVNAAQLELQKLVSQLELLDEKLSQEDVNKKLLRSLSPEWNTHAVVWRNKANLDTMSMDDLYNNLKVYEPEVKGCLAQVNAHRTCLLLSSTNNNNADNEAVNMSHGSSKKSRQQEQGKLRWSVHVETSTSTALVSCDGLGGYEWSDQAEEGLNYALMALSSLCPKSRATKDETSGIFKSFITGIENLVDHKVKMIRCDNGTEFKKQRDESVLSSHDDGSKPSSDVGKKVDEDPRKESECNDQENEDNINSTNNVNAAGTNEVNVVGGKTSIKLPFDPNMSALEDYNIFDFSRDDEDDGATTDINNLDTTIQVSPIPTIRIHKDHPLDQEALLVAQREQELLDQELTTQREQELLAQKQAAQEKQVLSPNSVFRQLIEEMCGTKVCEEQKQNMEDTMLELLEDCRQKELYCIHNNVDDLIESALNSKLLLINLNSQRLVKKKQEIKNIAEPAAKRQTRITSYLQNFKVIHKENIIPLNNMPQISFRLMQSPPSYQAEEHKYSPNFDFLLEEFSDELAYIDQIPPRIEEADFDLEEEIRLVENLSYDNSSPRPPEGLNAEIANTILKFLSPFPILVEDCDSHMEEIDLFLATVDSLPQRH
ncbi:hypothetical protein Tco_0532701 [Tanacetum coccineum]